MHKQSLTLFLTVAVVATCYLPPMVDCYRLKVERREGRKEAKAAKASIQEGRIVFGRYFAKGSGLESVADGNRKIFSNASGKDGTYQADFPGWSVGQVRDAISSDASWKRMAPSLQCGRDRMRFRAVGPGASAFALDQGDTAPVPLSQVPSTCGYSMQRNSLGLVMLAPYDGCNMVQRDGSYVLPMRWQGIPVSLWCPKPAAPASTESQTPEKPVSPDPATTPRIPDMPSYLQYPLFPLYPYFYAAPTTTAPPATTATTTVPAPLPMYPLPFYPSLHGIYPWRFRLPAAAEPPITQTSMTKPRLLPFPQNVPFYPQYFSHHPILPQFIPSYPRHQLPETDHMHHHFHNRFRPYLNYAIGPNDPPSH